MLEENLAQTNPKETLEELDKRCAEIAKQHIVDLNWDNDDFPLAARLAYSGFLPETYKEGFKNSSFHLNPDWPFNFQQYRNWTRNDTFDRIANLAVGYALHGKLDPEFDREFNNEMTKNGLPMTEEDYLRYVQDNYPEAFDEYAKRVAKAKQESEDAQKELGMGNIKKWEYEETKHAYERCFFNISEYRKLLDKLRKTGQLDLPKKIVIHILKGDDPENWSFEEQDFLLTSIVDRRFKMSENIVAGQQAYDIAYIVDIKNVKEHKSGYLGGEREITAGAESIEAIVLAAWSLPNSYRVEKLKRIFRNNPELSRPIYDWENNLIWPENKSAVEIKEMFGQKKIIEPIIDGRRIFFDHKEGASFAFVAMAEVMAGLIELNGNDYVNSLQDEERSLKDTSDREKKFENYLRQLNLVFKKTKVISSRISRSKESGFDYPSSIQVKTTYIFSKSKETLDEMAKALEEGNEERKLRLLGVPETAIKAHFEGSKIDPSELPEDVRETLEYKMAYFDLSRDHWQEELIMLKEKIQRIREKIPKLRMRERRR